ncbi:MAG: hypothetical protein EOP84_24840 [Verrucomicrobiaceae bacterium]|nr:MAG: hypothetical protein EOP84_24840 [Verrucomicrobiaceae bacterium]
MNSQLEDLFDRLGSLISAITPPLGLRVAEAFRSMAHTLLRGIAGLLGCNQTGGTTANLVKGLRDALANLGATPGVTKGQIEDVRSRYTRVREHVGISAFAWANPAWRRVPEKKAVVIQFPRRTER